VVGLKIKHAEPILKLVICRPPDSGAGWEWPYRAMNAPADQPADSCVVMYWADVTMVPAEERVLAFTYGVGRVTMLSDQERNPLRLGHGRMCVTVQDRIAVNKAFLVTAYFRRFSEETATIKLPASLELLPAQSADQSVPEPGPEGYSTVTWRVQGSSAGLYPVIVEAAELGAVRQFVEIRERGLFD
jgi:hypothetical protein